MATPNFPGNLASEVILLPPFQAVGLKVGFANASNIVSFSLNYTLQGGTFSFSILQNSAVLPDENAVLTLPFGRVGIVKTIGTSLTSGGLVDTVSGPILPLASTLTDSFTSNPGQFIFMADAANNFQGGAIWTTGSYQIKNFSYRGNSLGGIQQLAGYMLAEVIVRKGGVFVVDPGSPPGSALVFTPPVTDIVSCVQTMDFSLDVASILNPTLTQVNFIDDGEFVYDSDHAQKQPKVMVQAGAPGAQGATDFVPIPNDWLIDGNFEEWTPTDPTDLTNPNPTPTNGRYWRTFRSPTNPGMLRGVTNFTRLVKQINIPKNVSTFIGSPISGEANFGFGGFSAFQFANPGVQNGISGFNALETSLFDIVSNQFITIPNAIVLSPGEVVDSGFGASNFYSVLYELWMFPRVNPTVFPIGGANPFNIPRGVIVVTPNTSVFNGLSSGYYNKYLSNYKLINSPRKRTQLTIVYRGTTLPEPGDTLILPTAAGIRFPGAVGRISTVSLTYGRQGLVVQISAEQYQAAGGLWSNSPGSGLSG